MDKNKIYQAGEQIGELVQKAIDTQDFSQLSKTISEVIGQAADGLEDLVKDTVKETAKNAGNKNYGNSAGNAAGRNSGREKTYGAAGRNAGQENINGASGSNRGQEYSWGSQYRAASGKEAAERIRKNLSEQQKKRAEQGQPIFQVRRAPGLFTGRVQQVTGYSGVGLFGLLTLVGFSIESGAMSQGNAPVGTLFFGGLLALSAFNAYRGHIKVGRAKRFQRYEDIMGDRTFIEVRELADGIGKSEEYVRKDLAKMVEKGFFPEGHLDQTGSWLITSKESYQQYLAAQRSYEQRSRQAKNVETAAKERQSAKKETPASENPFARGAVSLDGKDLPPECRKLIEDGNRYIAFIHECNDRLPGEEISDKLDRLEQVITRIFQEVARRPQLAPELRKMMNYYLPTTQKLLDAYCSLEEQHVSGTNIDKTKKEIEDALDTINRAFETLLDGFFEHTSWDISSDISVLNSMFAQEGLTGTTIREQMNGDAGGKTGKEQKEEMAAGAASTAASVASAAKRKPELSFGAAQTAGKILDAMGGAAAAAPEPEKDEE